ncbi:MAG TPA: menaquinone biosynthesis protein [Chthoniobacterales bacterium]|nr:menaquinone biosynthesis protein [Chthoniobacterales bacterium]
MNSLRVGCVKYLNARPLIQGWHGHVEFDHPSALCRRLARGDIDLALVSSFEFLRNPIYRIVDCVSLSSDGPVYSVIVAHRGDISKVEQIELDPAAETSVNLLRCLLAELSLTPRLVASSTSSRSGRLLIGDQAIEFRQQHGTEFHYWDLGAQWKGIVDLPFVYALWLIRPEVGDANAIADELRALRDENLATLDELLAQEKKFDRAFCRRYYRDNLRFSFGDREKRGLQRFAELCTELDLIPKRALKLELV